MRANDAGGDAWFWATRDPVAEAWRIAKLRHLKAGAPYTVSLSNLPNATWAAARRAMGTRNGEQLT